MVPQVSIFRTGSSTSIIKGSCKGILYSAYLGRSQSFSMWRAACRTEYMLLDPPPAWERRTQRTGGKCTHSGPTAVKPMQEITSIASDTNVIPRGIRPTKMFPLRIFFPFELLSLLYKESSSSRSNSCNGIG